MRHLLLTTFLLAAVSGQTIIDLASEFKIEEGNNATLSCSAISWHPAAHIEWKTLQDGRWTRIANHGAISLEFRSKFSVTLSSGDDSKLTSTLDILEVGYTESGIYRCEAYKDGSVQSSVNHTIIVYKNESTEILNITSVSASRSSYSMIYVNWNYPTGYTSEEKWFFKVHARFVQGTTITTKEIDAASYSPRSNFPWTGLLPCTDYQVWITGYSRRYVPRRSTTPRPNRYNRYRYIGQSNNRYPYQQQNRNRPLLHGVYRRAVSTSTAWTRTDSAAPKEVMKRQDIEIVQRPGVGENCSMYVTWKPTVKPFGCRTKGFELAVKTPDTWHNFRILKGIGDTAIMKNLSCSMAYPVLLRPYNRFGYGKYTPMFFVQFNKKAPPPPTSLKADVDCKQIKVTWAPPNGTYQIIYGYDISVEQPDNGSSYSGRTISAETEHTLVSFLSESDKLVVTVRSRSSWGTSAPAVIDVTGKAGCVKPMEYQASTEESVNK